MVVEGTPLQQNNRFALGTPSSSEDEEDSPLLLSEREPSVATASMSTSTMAAKFSHEKVESALAEIAESNRQMVALEGQCNRDYESNMASLGGRHSRVEQMFSAVSEHIGVVWAESSSLVVMNRDICTMVGDSMATFLRTMEINDQKYRDAWADTDLKNKQAWAAYEQRVLAMTEMHTKSISDNSKSISDMQVKLQSSFDRMKYLEQKVQTHLEDRLPVILTAVVDKALAPTLTTVLTECLPPTITLVLEGSLADFKSQFGSAGGTASTQQVREVLEAAADFALANTLLS
jgi:hypothetical protein